MHVRHLTFRLLQVFVQVVRCGNISHAAQQLHLTQPTVSQQLKRLSETIGEPLFLQTTGRLQLSPVGAALYELCQDTLGQFDAFGQFLQDYRSGLQGQFSLALVNTAQYILPRILGPFQQHYPNIEVRLQIGNRQQVLSYFEHQADDLYVFSHPPSGPSTQAARVINNPLVIIASQQHPLAKQDKLVFSQLLKERFLLREPGSATRMLFDSWLLNQDYLLAKSLQMASNEAICVGVASGLGLAVVSRHVLAGFLNEVNILPVQGFDLHSHWHYVRRQGHHLPMSAQRFVQFTQDNLQQCLDPQWLAADLPLLTQRLLDQPLARS